VDKSSELLQALDSEATSLRSKARPAGKEKKKEEEPEEDGDGEEEQDED